MLLCPQSPGSLLGFSERILQLWNTDSITQSSIDLGLTVQPAPGRAAGGWLQGGPGMSQAPVTWQALTTPVPPIFLSRRAQRTPPSRTPQPGQARPSPPSLPPPSNGRGAGHAEQDAADQPGPRPVPGSRAGPRRPLNAAQGRRGAALATFLTRAATAAPREGKHPDSAAVGQAAAATSDLRARAASSPASPATSSRAFPAGRVGAGPPGVRTRVPVCARAPAGLGPAPPPGAGPPRDPHPRAVSRVPRRQPCTQPCWARRWRDLWPTVMP